MPGLSFFSTLAAEPRDREATAQDADASGKGSVPLWRSGAILLLTGIVVLSYWLNPPPTLAPQAGVTLDLPNQVGHYHGINAKFLPVELENLPEDTGFARKDYDDFQGHQIRCSIVLSGAEKRSIHRAEACLAAQGWTIVNQSNTPVQLTSGRTLVVRNLSLSREIVNPNTNQHYSIRALYLYWFVGENVTTPSHYTRVFLTDWDHLVHNISHRWAYVSVFSPITETMRTDGLNAAQTQQLLTDFIRESVPLYQKSEMPQQQASN